MSRAKVTSLVLKQASIRGGCLADEAAGGA